MQIQEQYSKALIKGEFTDTITYENGEVEVREGQNLIVDSICNLIACLLKVKEGYTGLSYWAIGIGEEEWDDNEVAPSLGDTQLVNEIFRKPIQREDIHFLDENYQETERVTNRIGVKVLFTSSEANDNWREFGLFGGDATNIKDSGIMINHKIHKALPKDSNMNVERYIRFTFL